MPDSCGVAILGCGYWGVNYVRNFGELPDARVAVVCDQRPERLNEIRQRFPAVPVAADIPQALATGGVDAAVVCTPATSHHAVIRRCLEAGKHVLVEKPMTTDSVHAAEVIDLAADRGLTLMVGHTFLFNDGVRALGRWIDAGRAGRIHYLYSRRTNLGPIRQDVNALWDLAPHDVAIFGSLLGAVPEWVSAVGGRVLGTPREDVGFVCLGYPGGVVAHLHVSWADPHKVREVVVVGSASRLVFDDLDKTEPVRVFEKGIGLSDGNGANGSERLSIRDGDILSPRIAATEPLRNQCAHFLHCLLRGQEPLTDGTAGLDVVLAMEAIDRSLVLGGAAVPVAPSTASLSSRRQHAA